MGQTEKIPNKLTRTTEQNYVDEKYAKRRTKSTRETVLILDAGHFALDTAPDQIADLVRNFHARQCMNFTFASSPSQLPSRMATFRALRESLRLRGPMK